MCNDVLVTIPVWAKRIGRSKSTVRREVNAGLIPHVRRGERMFVVVRLAQERLEQEAMETAARAAEEGETDG